MLEKEFCYEDNYTPIYSHSIAILVDVSCPIMVQHIMYYYIVVRTDENLTDTFHGNGFGFTF